MTKLFNSLMAIVILFSIVTITGCNNSVDANGTTTSTVYNEEKAKKDFQEVDDKFTFDVVDDETIIDGQWKYLVHLANASGISRFQEPYETLIVKCIMERNNAAALVMCKTFELIFNDFLLLPESKDYVEGINHIKRTIKGYELGIMGTIGPVEKVDMERLMSKVRDYYKVSSTRAISFGPEFRDKIWATKS